MFKKHNGSLPNRNKLRFNYLCVSNLTLSNVDLSPAFITCLWASINLVGHSAERLFYLATRGISGYAGAYGAVGYL